MMNAHGVPFHVIDDKRVVLYKDMSATIQTKFREHLRESPATALHLRSEGVPHSVYADWADKVCP